MTLPAVAGAIGTAAAAAYGVREATKPKSN